MFKIEKGVPPPKKGASSKYPFAAMEVNDSFFVPGATPVQLRSAASAFGRRNDQKHSVAKEADGVRVWRIS